MTSQLSDQVIGMTRSTAAHFQLEKYSRKSLQDTPHFVKNGSHQIHNSNKELVISRQKKREKVDSFAQEIREHIRLAPKLTETLKGKLTLGARILKVGGLEKVFKNLYSVKDGEEKLMKASQCYLSTTNSPIAGLLFISTERLAFCSERSIKIVSPTGKPLRIYYKVSIPLRKIMAVDTSHDTKKPSQKYIEVVTEDNFEFWFMGFLNHRKTFQCLQQWMIMSQAH